MAAPFICEVERDARREPPRGTSRPADCTLIEDDIQIS